MFLVYGEALPTMINRILNPQIQDCLLLKNYEEVPYYAMLYIFYCSCFIPKSQVKGTKLSRKSILCVILGYNVT